MRVEFVPPGQAAQITSPTELLDPSRPIGF